MKSMHFFLYESLVKCGPARKRLRNVCCKFLRATIPGTVGVHELHKNPVCDLKGSVWS